MRYDEIPYLSGAVPFRGHGPEVGANRYGLFARAIAEIDDLGRLRFPTRDVVFVNSPRAIHEVLVEKAKFFAKSPVLRAALHPLAGEGLFTSGGELWRRQRKLMAPIFHHVKVDAFAPAMVDCARDGVAGWSDGATIDVARETTRIAMSVAGKTLFGADTNDDAEAIGHALTVALHWVDEASTSLPLILQVELRTRLMDVMDRTARSGSLHAALERVTDKLEPPILWPSARNRELKKAVALLDDKVQRMIDERRASTEPRADLLSHLLRARDEDDGSRMSDKQVRDEIMTLFVAGHETTANGLAWALYLLARNPDTYARARATVDALEGRLPTFSDLPRLGYLQRVFKEALRLYPPVYLYGRVATDDVELVSCPIPKNSILLVSPYTVQRRADLWPDPLRFDPERFLPAAEAQRPRAAFIPFSDGPRVCIGAHFALIEAPLVLATMLQRADLRLVDDREILPDRSATLRPDGGVPMHVRLRAPSTVSSAVN